MYTVWQSGAPPRIPGTLPLSVTGVGAGTAVVVPCMWGSALYRHPWRIRRFPYSGCQVVIHPRADSPYGRIRPVGAAAAPPSAPTALSRTSRSGSLGSCACRALLVGPTLPLDAPAALVPRVFSPLAFGVCAVLVPRVLARLCSACPPRSLPRGCSPRSRSACRSRARLCGRSTNARCGRLSPSPARIGAALHARRNARGPPPGMPRNTCSIPTFAATPLLQVVEASSADRLPNRRPLAAPRCSLQRLDVLLRFVRGQVAMVLHPSRVISAIARGASGPSRRSRTRAGRRSSIPSSAKAESRAEHQFSRARFCGGRRG